MPHMQPSTEYGGIDIDFIFQANWYDQERPMHHKRRYCKRCGHRLANCNNTETCLHECAPKTIKYSHPLKVTCDNIHYGRVNNDYHPEDLEHAPFRHYQDKIDKARSMWYESFVGAVRALYDQHKKIITVARIFKIHRDSVSKIVNRKRAVEI